MMKFSNLHHSLSMSGSEGCSLTYFGSTAAPEGKGPPVIRYRSHGATPSTVKSLKSESECNFREKESVFGGASQLSGYTPIEVAVLLF